MFRIRIPFAPKLLVLEIRSSINSYCSLSETRIANSERVVSLFKANGFTDAQITTFTRKLPDILSSDPQKTLAPKFDFFRSLGISDTHIPKILISNPSLLMTSLKNQLIPCRNYLKSLLHNDEDVAKVIKKHRRILRYSVDNLLVPTIRLLREVGVPESKVQYMLLLYPDAFRSYNRFKSKVEEVVSLGFDPTKYVFLDALNLMCCLNQTNIDRKWAAYRKSNLSDDEIRTAFRAFPNCMKLSEEKITRTVDFLVNQMGFKVVRIITWPVCITYNLEKGIIPRCRVIKVLQSHGVLKKDISLGFLGISETKFLKKFVSKYEDKVPGLSKIYINKMDCLETAGIRSDNTDATNWHFE